jgi:hypothetical protein
MHKTLSIKYPHTINSGYLIIGISVLSIIEFFAIKHFLLTEAFYYQTFSEQLSTTQINKLLMLQKEYRYLAFAFLILSKLIKYITVASVLYIGCYFFNCKIKFNSIFKTVIFSESVFLFATFFKIVWFLYINPDFTYQEYNYFAPLSVLALLDAKNISTMWLYCFQTINIFDFSYLIMLAYGLSKFLNNLDTALKIVLSSYLPALFLWIVFVMFIMVALIPV